MILIFINYSNCGLLNFNTLKITGKRTDLAGNGTRLMKTTEVTPTYERLRIDWVGVGVERISVRSIAYIE